MSDRKLIDFAYREWRESLDDPALASPTSFEAGYLAALSAPIPRSPTHRQVEIMAIMLNVGADYRDILQAVFNDAAPQPAEQTTINDAGAASKDAGRALADMDPTAREGIRRSAQDRPIRPETQAGSAASPSAQPAVPEQGVLASTGKASGCNPEVAAARAGSNPADSTTTQPAATPPEPETGIDNGLSQESADGSVADPRDTEIARYKEALRKYVIDSVDTDIGRIVRCLECVQIWGDGKPENHTPSCLARGNAP